jgi:dihydrofolate reductase
MRSLEYYVILTADGMYADLDGGLDHYEPAEDEHRFANELLRASGGEVMGRRMYDVMDYWDELDVSAPATPEVERDYAELWRETPKYVISRGSPPLRSNAQVLEGDVVEAIRALKTADGPPLGLGCGAELLATLSEAGLIDVYRWLVIPKAIGQGRPLFGAFTSPMSLRLVGTRTFDAGSVLFEYAPEES